VVVIPRNIGFSKMVNDLMKNIFENNPIVIFVILLILFILIGSAGIGFAITNPNPLPLMGWIVFLGFIVIPGIIIYSLTFGFEISNKQTKTIEDRRDSLLCDEKGFSVVMPLHAATWIIHWDSIETIIYTNFSSDDEAYYSFKLNKIPEYSVHENPWWLAKLFPMKPKRKSVRVGSDSKNFSQLPHAVKSYLELSEYWKPNQNYDSIQLLFDRQKRTLDEIRKSESQKMICRF
jgi:hypothetical protein